MSKLVELIQELCPDGVEFRKLGEISQYCKERIDASTVDKTCYVGVENLLQNKQGKTLSSAVPTTGQVIAFSCGDILIGNIRPYLKKIWLADCNGGTNGDVLAIHITDSGMLPEFLYYVLSSDSFFHYDMQYAKGSKMPRGSKEAVLQYITPVPPLPVQREIVRILDNFTELTAELTARKKQYAYYRDKLLTPRTDYRHGKIIDMLKQPITDGPHTTPELMEDGIPFLSVEAVFDGKIHFEKRRGNITPEFDAECCKKYKPQKHDIFMVKSGSTTGKVGYVDTDERFNIWSPLAAMRVNSENSSRYLFHLLQSKMVQQQVVAKASHGSQPNLSMRALEQFDVAIPPLDIQLRLANVLDNFDAICTDLSSGLPAEIEARQKQYEYYRDKLLTFKTMSNQQ